MLLLLLFCFVVFVLGARDRTRGLAHAGQALYHWAMSPAPLDLILVVSQMFMKIPS